MPRNFAKEDVLEAIKDSRGIVWTVSKKLKCAHLTAGKYVEKWAATREAMAAETAIVVDKSEMCVFDSIESGDVASAKWFLSKKAKDRGYGESLELGGEVKGQLIVVRYGDSNKDQNGTPA